ncbi:MAG: hypothetical protein RBS39_07495 [Phycisphaerales bacterium]|jgi:hypothetical protein|nr:hypothetical protein [Phycisphaerales bacterium]
MGGPEENTGEDAVRHAPEVLVLTSERVEFGTGDGAPRSMLGTIVAGVVGLLLLVGGVLLAVFVFLPLAIAVIVLAICVIAWARLRARWNARFGDRMRGRRNVRVVDSGPRGE